MTNITSHAQMHPHSQNILTKGSQWGFFYLWDALNGREKVYQNLTSGGGLKLDHIQDGR